MLVCLHILSLNGFNFRDNVTLSISFLSNFDVCFGLVFNEPKILCAIRGFILRFCYYYRPLLYASLTPKVVTPVFVLWSASYRVRFD